MDMYFETSSILTPLLTNFAEAVFASNHAYTLVPRYEYFYIAITIVDFISIYQYIAHITTCNSDSLQGHNSFSIYLLPFGGIMQK